MDLPFSFILARQGERNLLVDTGFHAGRPLQRIFSRIRHPYLDLALTAIEGNGPRGRRITEQYVRTSKRKKKPSANAVLLSRFRASNTPAPANGRWNRAAPTTRSFDSKTTAMSPASSIASFRSACSNMSALASMTLLSQMRQILADDGVFVLHSIGRSGPPSVTNPWIAKYIFPGGYIPALSEILPPVQTGRIDCHRRRSAATPLRLHAQGLARAVSGASRGGGAALRRTICSHVGVLPRVVGDGFPRERHGGVPAADGQAQGRRAANARLHRPRRGAAARR